MGLAALCWLSSDTSNWTRKARHIVRTALSLHLQLDDRPRTRPGELLYAVSAGSLTTGTSERSILEIEAVMGMGFASGHLLAQRMTATAGLL